MESWKWDLYWESSSLRMWLIFSPVVSNLVCDSRPDAAALQPRESWRMWSVALYAKIKDCLLCYQNFLSALDGACYNRKTIIFSHGLWVWPLYLLVFNSWLHTFLDAELTVFHNCSHTALFPNMQLNIHKWHLHITIRSVHSSGVTLVHWQHLSPNKKTVSLRLDLKKTQNTIKR